MKKTTLALWGLFASTSVQAHPGHTDFQFLPHALLHLMQNEFLVGLSLLAATSVALIFMLRR